MNPIIRSLATSLNDLQISPIKHKGYDPVVVLQPTGTKTPLWLIHPGIGEMLVFLSLTQFLPDRPMYAMIARGLNKGKACFSGLEEVLSTYHSAIKKKQAHGPYALASDSYGSKLAFEIAKILKSHLESVRFLGSFNLPPHIRPRTRRLDWTAGLLHIAHFCGIITGKRSEELVEELRPLPLEEQVALLLTESDQTRCQELALDHADLHNWTDVSWSLQKTGWEYEPSSTVPNIDVFYCQPLKDVAKTRAEYRKEHLNRWVDFFRDG